MKSLVVAFLLVVSGAVAAPPEFFVFDNGVGRGSWTPEQQAAALKELGYDGISYNYTNNQDLAEWLRVFKARGLKIYGLYVHTFPDKQPSFDPALHEAIKMLRGSGTVVWMTLREVKDKTRNYDAEAVKIVRELADLAAEQGVRVALYPHARFYVECAADADRIVKLANHPNAGASLNLCHEFMTGHGDKLDATIALAAPLATLISVNGVDTTSKQYILRLDQGNFDVAGFLKKVYAAGYKGPVGLQCYRVPGDVKENLTVNIATWKTIAAKLR